MHHTLSVFSFKQQLPHGSAAAHVRRVLSCACLLLLLLLLPGRPAVLAAADADS
jgi:hypothetical protein